MTRELIAQAEALSSVIDSVENCPILYSDTIRSRQVNRDDLWAITTEQLLYLRQLVRLFRAQAEQPAEHGEPVAWLHQICDDQGNGSVIASLNENIDLDASEMCVSTPLYAHPDPRIAALEGLLREALDYIPTYKGNETGSANFANRVREVLKGKYDD